MKMNTGLSPVYMPREHIKQNTPIRAKLTALRLKLGKLEDAGQADSPRGRELRAQIAILVELVDEAR